MAQGTNRECQREKTYKKGQLPLSLIIINPNMGVLGQKGVSTMIICFFERWAQMQNSEELMVSCPLTNIPNGMASGTV